MQQTFIPGANMSEKAKQADRLARTIGAPDAKAPPARVVRESFAKLKRSISDQQQKHHRLVMEQTKLRQEINAPILDLLKSDPRSKVASKALRKTYDRLRTEAAVDLRAPKLAYSVYHPGDADNVWIAEPSYPLQHAIKDRADDLATSEDNGHLHCIVAPRDGKAWAWAGVGLHVIPRRDLNVRVTPHMSYRYSFLGSGNWGVSAHCEGALGIHVHRYDGDWQDTDDTQDFRTPLWSHTTETEVN